MIEYLKLPTFCDACKINLIAQANVIAGINKNAPAFGYCSHDTDQAGDVVLATVSLRDGSVHRVTLKGPMPEAEALEAIARAFERAAIILTRKNASVQ